MLCWRGRKTLLHPVYVSRWAHGHHYQLPHLMHNGQMSRLSCTYHDIICRDRQRRTWLETEAAISDCDL